MWILAHADGKQGKWIGCAIIDIDFGGINNWEQLLYAECERHFIGPFHSIWAGVPEKQSFPRISSPYSMRRWDLWPHQQSQCDKVLQGLYAEMHLGSKLKSTKQLCRIYGETLFRELPRDCERMVRQNGLPLYRINRGRMIGTYKHCCMYIQNRFEVTSI